MPATAESVFRHYNPVNSHIEFIWEPIKQGHLSGGGVTTTYFGDRPYVSGAPINSYYITTDYEVTMQYIGPVNIGEKVLLKRVVPNFHRDPKVVSETISATGVKPYSDTCCGPAYSDSTIDCCVMTSIILCACGGCCLLCCLFPSRSATVEKNKAAYEAKLNEIADDRMSRQLAQLLQQADESLSGRLKYIQDQAKLQADQQRQLLPVVHPASAAGNVGVNVDPRQFQQFIQFQQFQRMQAQPGLAQVHPVQGTGAQVNQAPVPIGPTPMASMAVAAPGAVLPSVVNKPAAVAANRA